ncbi:hypothetical protein MMC08_008424 [Hypocenomyce scalaris]|nr:hypothetical protein [Hypocenomyce scalaris]
MGPEYLFASVGKGFKENRTSVINNVDKTLGLLLANQPPEFVRPEKFRSNQHGYGAKKGSSTAAPRHQGPSAQDVRVMGIESLPLLEQHLLTSYNAKKVYMSPPAMTVITEPVLQDWGNDAPMDSYGTDQLPQHLLKWKIVAMENGPLDKVSINL